MRFHSSKGTVMKAVVRRAGILDGQVSIQIDNDPFPVEVPPDQLTREEVQDEMSPTATAPSAKELRREAKRLKIAGYESMGREELEEAVKTANGADSDTAARKTRSTTTKSSSNGTSKASTKKAGATKKAANRQKATTADDSEPSGDPGNPFRAGTNLWHVTEALKKGGKRSALVAKLEPKLKFNPRTKGKDFDVAEEIDRRLKVIGYLLKNTHGWTYEHTGRGKDAYIKVTPPE